MAMTKWSTRLPIFKSRIGQILQSITDRRIAFFESIFVSLIYVADCAPASVPPLASNTFRRYTAVLVRQQHFGFLVLVYFNSLKYYTLLLCYCVRMLRVLNNYNRALKWCSFFSKA